jgi:hypothetical protein
VTADEIIWAACERAGTCEYHDHSFREGLEILVEDIARSTVVSDEGRAVLAELWIAGLVNRLRLDNYHRSHPELATARVERPLFVLGMPRTGTTMVSALLEADPARRSLLKWEIADSVPPADRASLRTDPRCLAMKAADEAAIAANPRDAALHNEVADGPTECTFLHAQDFRSCMLEALSPVPAYSRWLLHEANLGSTYRFQKRALQVLQSRTDGIWSLKMPSHALFIRMLIEVFPDARIVWVHRDPYTAMSSLCSLVENAQTKFNRVVSRAYLRETYVPQMSEHLRRPMAVDADYPGLIRHLRYDRLVADPIAAMRELYAELGDAFTPETEAAMRAWLADNPQGKFGRHVHRLADYGLSVEALEPSFGDYVARYDVAREG